MNEITIKRHSFESATNRIKEFSEKTEAELKIDKVQIDGGLFGLGDHKVTGYELNRRLETIQNHFIAVNTTNNKMIKEFREIYNAFDALDRDYIASIVANVKAIEKTSNDVRVQQETLKQHNNKIADQQSKLDAHQIEIEKNLATISKIVTVLKVFKEKLEGYSHLTDIDKIWNDCKTIQSKIQVVSDNITKLSKKTTEDIAAANNKNKSLSDQVNRDIITLRNEAKSFRKFYSDLSEKVENTANLLDNQIMVIQEISSFLEQLKNISHINDIDSMWNEINKAKKCLDTISKSLQNIDAGILNMQKHIDKIDAFILILNEYSHLKDIDNMWDTLESTKAHIERINENVQKQQSELDNLTVTSNEHNVSIDTLFTKMAIADKYAVESRNSITELVSFRERISALSHLMDIDEIWEQTKAIQNCINNVENEGKSHADKLNELFESDERLLKIIESNICGINSLKEYKDQLNCISHLTDVDSMWKKVEEQTSLLNESKAREEELNASIQNTNDEINKKIVETAKMSNTAIELLKKKVKYAYWIAGGSIGFSIIELILLLMKVI